MRTRRPVVVGVVGRRDVTDRAASRWSSGWLSVRAWASGGDVAGRCLPDFVGAVEAGSCDDVAGHGGDRLVEGEGVGQAGAVVEGEELEDVRVRSVRTRGQRARPAFASEAALAVVEAGDAA